MRRIKYLSIRSESKSNYVNCIDNPKIKKIRKVPHGLKCFDARMPSD